MSNGRLCQRHLQQMPFKAIAEVIVENENGEESHAIRLENSLALVTSGNFRAVNPVSKGRSS